jgi:hypothetical protein
MWSRDPLGFQQTSDKTNRLPWRDDLLRKSPSFPKALRQSGRSGKVVIEGWVAFQGGVTWKEIVGNPMRSDFRYVVLLDDKSLLKGGGGGGVDRRRKRGNAVNFNYRFFRSLSLSLSPKMKQSNNTIYSEWRPHPRGEERRRRRRDER